MIVKLLPAITSMQRHLKYYNLHDPTISKQWNDTLGYFWQGGIMGLSPKKEERPLLVTLEGCYAFCGRGFQLYDLTEIANILTTWVLPALSLVVQLPYESNSLKKNFWAFCRWIGCPPAALASTLWNVWITKKCEERSHEYYSASGRAGSGSMGSRDAFYVLSVLNQYHYNVNDRLLHKTVFYGLFEPDIGVELAVLAQNLRAHRRKTVVPLMLSLLWFVVALLVSMIQAFGDLGDSTTAHSLALGLLLSWLPGLAAMSIVDRNPVAANRSKALIEKWLHNAQYHEQLGAVRFAEKELEFAVRAVESHRKGVDNPNVFENGCLKEHLIHRLRDAIMEVKREATVTLRALSLIRLRIAAPQISRRRNSLARITSRTNTGGAAGALEAGMGGESLVERKDWTNLDIALNNAISSLEAHTEEFQQIETRLVTMISQGPMDAEFIERYKGSLTHAKDLYFPARLIRTIRKTLGVTRMDLLNAIALTAKQIPTVLPTGKVVTIPGIVVTTEAAPQAAMAKPEQYHIEGISPSTLSSTTAPQSISSALTATSNVYRPNHADPEVLSVLALFSAQVNTLASSGYWKGGPRRLRLGEFRGQGRHPWHYGCVAAVFKRLEIEAETDYHPQRANVLIAHYVEDSDSLRPRSQLGDELFMAILRKRSAFFSTYATLWAFSVISFILSVSMAFLVSFMTPTIGLGCRSFMYMLYGVLVMAGVLMEIIGGPLNSHRRRRYLRIILVAARVFEILATFTLFSVILVQLFGFFQSCYCKASVFGGLGGYLGFENGEYYRQYGVEKFWIAGAVIGVLIILTHIGWAGLQWLRCKALWRADEDPRVDISVDWDVGGTQRGFEESRWEMYWLR